MSRDHLLGTIFAVGEPMVRALQEDAMARTLDRALAPTPAELKAQEREMANYAFEHGDHQPDGRILPKKSHDYWQGRTPNYYGGRWTKSAVGTFDCGGEMYADKHDDSNWKPVPADSEVVELKVHMLMPRADAAAMRAILKADPEQLMYVLRMLQQAAEHELQACCGLRARPLA